MVAEKRRLYFSAAGRSCEAASRYEARVVLRMLDEEVLYWKGDNGVWLAETSAGEGGTTITLDELPEEVKKQK